MAIQVAALGTGRGRVLCRRAMVSTDTALVEDGMYEGVPAHVLSSHIAHVGREERDGDNDDDELLREVR